jgi:antitoxin (DNA-binding transcriptional repressor) of toxin-antitoxin stability system
MSTYIKTVDLRKNLSQIIQRVAFQGEHVIVSRSGHGMIAMIDLESYEAFKAYEDRMDQAVAERRLEDFNLDDAIPADDV